MDMVEGKFEVRKENGMKIVGKIFAPDGSNEKGKKYPVVIVSHGFNSCYSDLEHHGAGYVDKEIVCVMFDFCGGGERSLSDGKLTDMTPITEAEDLTLVIDFVRELEYVDETKLFLLGESQGGFESAYVAAKMPEKIRGLILWYPAFVIPSDSRKRFETNDNTCFGIELCPDYNMVAKDIDNDELMKAYEGPVLLIHGDKDSIVPISYSIEAQRKYKNAKMITILGADHGYEGQDSVDARNYSIEFIKGNNYLK